MKTVTQEELTELQNLRTSFVEIVTRIGELNLAKFLLNKEATQMAIDIELEQEKFIQLQETERVLYEALNKKYGTGNIDVDTGEIKE